MIVLVHFLIDLNVNLCKPSNIENREHFKLKPLAVMFVSVVHINHLIIPQTILSLDNCQQLIAVVSNDKRFGKISFQNSVWSSKIA